MCEESAPSFAVYILLGCSGFVYSFGSLYDAESKNIHELISMGSGLMCNDSDVGCGSMDLNIFVRDSSERWKSLESESAMMFSKSQSLIINTIRAIKFTKKRLIFYFMKVCTFRSLTVPHMLINHYLFFIQWRGQSVKFFYDVV